MRKANRNRVEDELDAIEFEAKMLEAFEENEEYLDNMGCGIVGDRPIISITARPMQSSE